MTKDDFLKKIQKYPHVAQKVSLCWDNKDILAKYLTSLIYDTRDGLRKGFPVETAEELLRIINTNTVVDGVMEEDFKIKEDIILPKNF
jgi:hypothetical protein